MTKLHSYIHYMITDLRYIRLHFSFITTISLSSNNHFALCESWNLVKFTSSCRYSEPTSWKPKSTSGNPQSRTISNPLLGIRNPLVGIRHSLGFLYMGRNRYNINICGIYALNWVSALFLV